ncbi:hypothetical protein CNE_BB1p09740 (plasmid) [Cupriavidus necator N-1]|uniref:AB hydrolase-1 domain-containing protein n=1 Tax=Cupriavidus necator (strain ATCC 43291 / DSM 13513 / CCUG 52238 / LMG 8453 / N-1) TaxID=1042878 RepID=F8GUI1_CUPNN|nr:alpha/beta fold hydrolase [Cupriavidus necator]AEI82385.1 hypothetical protein CNE_BB1p09740 [Cupriavidus necator N-1]MDX6007393.1 alpha/beta fold hydrolase [Cupriavidus necator]
MEAIETFTIDTGTETLAADRIAVRGKVQCLLLHGAGMSTRVRWLPLRTALAQHGVGTVAIDFSGHGDSSSRTEGSLEKRFDEALLALEHIDADGPRVVVGISMSGEIAVRLAVDKATHISGVVTIVGAAYDPAAYQIPFGPEFTRILRSHESWRKSEVFSAIQSFRGRIAVIQAGNDEVVPGMIGSDLIRNASCAEHAELLVLPGVSHALANALDDNPKMTQDVARAIARTIRVKRMPAIREATA